jgi:NitT/TauT family transport system substrate-binding protein
MTKHKLRLKPTGMRLHDWIAYEGSYWADERLEVEYLWDVIQATYAYCGVDYKGRPQDGPFVKGEEVVCNACAWGSVANAGAGMGKFSADAYGVARHAIFVRPESPIQEPEELAGVGIGVALRAGSHFSVPLSLEPYLPFEQIKPVNVGGHGTRLAVLLSGEVQASNLLDPEISMAEELGLRKVLEGTFNTLWWVDAGMDPAVLAAYFRVLARAEEDLKREPERYLPLWKYSIPGSFRGRGWDFSRFHEGEHFVYAPFPMAKYDELMDQMARWGLDDVMGHKEYQELVLAG